MKAPIVGGICGGVVFGLISTILFGAYFGGAASGPIEAFLSIVFAPTLILGKLMFSVFGPLGNNPMLFGSTVLGGQVIFWGGAGGLIGWFLQWRRQQRE